MASSSDDSGWEALPTSSSASEALPTQLAPTDKDAFKSWIQQMQSTMMTSSSTVGTNTSDSKLSPGSGAPSTPSTSSESPTSSPNRSANTFQNLAPGAKAGVALCIALASLGILASVIYLSVRYKKKRARINEAQKTSIYGWKPELDGTGVTIKSGSAELPAHSTREVHELPVPWTASELDQTDNDVSTRDEPIQSPFHEDNSTSSNSLTPAD